MDDWEYFKKKHQWSLFDEMKFNSIPLTPNIKI